MVNITLAISNELKEKMEEYSEVNWSEVARLAFIKYIQMRDGKK